MLARESDHFFAFRKLLHADWALHVASRVRIGVNLVELHHRQLGNLRIREASARVHPEPSDFNLPIGKINGHIPS